MHPTKEELIRRNGLKCMFCGKELPYNQLYWHHIKPRGECKREGKPVDDSYQNGSLLCLECHAYVHALYKDKYEYELAMSQIRFNKQ